jgi:hypothetical protein
MRNRELIWGILPITEEFPTGSALCVSKHYNLQYTIVQQHSWEGCGAIIIMMHQVTETEVKCLGEGQSMANVQIFWSRVLSAKGNFFF